MKKYKITWKGIVHGDIEIEASSAQEAKEKLANISRPELLKMSTIWNSDELVQIEGVDTKYGYVDQETWELLESD